MKITNFTMYHQIIWKKKEAVFKALMESNDPAEIQLLAIQLRVLNDLYFEANFVDPLFEEHDCRYEDK